MSTANDIVIRRFVSDDADIVSRLIIDNLMQVNVVDYGEAAVEQLAQFYSPERLRKYAQQSEMYVATQGADIIGTINRDQDHLRALFVRIDHHKQGIGTLLMHHVEEAAREQNQTRSTLLANVGAVSFYRKLGYVQVELKEIEVGNTRITVAAMEKSLQT